MLRGVTTTEQPTRSGASVAPAFRDFDSAVVFVEKHRRYFHRDADGVVDTYTEWRGSTSPEAPSSLVYSLSIVCPGHYAIERDADSLLYLWAQAGSYYADPSSIYNNGCNGSCLRQSGEQDG